MVTVVVLAAYAVVHMCTAAALTPDALSSSEVVAMRQSGGVNRRRSLSVVRTMRAAPLMADPAATQLLRFRDDGGGNGTSTNGNSTSTNDSGHRKKKKHKKHHKKHKKHHKKKKKTKAQKMREKRRKMRCRLKTQHKVDAHLLVRNWPTWNEDLSVQANTQLQKAACTNAANFVQFCYDAKDLKAPWCYWPRMDCKLKPKKRVNAVPLVPDWPSFGWRLQKAACLSRGFCWAKKGKPACYHPKKRY